MQTLPTKTTELAAFLNVSAAYASQLKTGARAWPRTLALRVFRETGEKVGELVNATDDEIDVLERFDTPQQAAA
jgi:F420-0:gamma-glutamyl ligase-like protein